MIISSQCSFALYSCMKFQANFKKKGVIKLRPLEMILVAVYNLIENDP